MNNFKKSSKWSSSLRDVRVANSSESSKYNQVEFASTVSKLLNDLLSKKKYNLITDYKEPNFIDYFVVTLHESENTVSVSIDAFVGDNIYHIGVSNTLGILSGFVSLNTNESKNIPNEVSTKLLSYISKYQPLEVGGTYIKDKNSTYGTNVIHYLSSFSNI